VQDLNEAQRVAIHYLRLLERPCKAAAAAAGRELTLKAMVDQPVHMAQLPIQQIPIFNQASETQQEVLTVEVQQAAAAVPAVQAVVEQVAVVAVVPVLLAASPVLH
jgi:hypothetical protein